MGVEKCPGCTALVRVYARREVQHDADCKLKDPRTTGHAGISNPNPIKALWFHALDRCGAASTYKKPKRY